MQGAAMASACMRTMVALATAALLLVACTPVCFAAAAPGDLLLFDNATDTLAVRGAPAPGACCMCVLSDEANDLMLWH